jgi:hypothetical protein
LLQLLSSSSFPSAVSTWPVLPLYLHLYLPLHLNYHEHWHTYADDADTVLFIDSLAAIIHAS